MAEDKDEGEVQRTSRGSSVEEGHFSNGLDDQISTIEDQLKRAEATLFDLQSLRGKLEAERQTNLRRAKEEQEYQESISIKKENDRLRRELKEYHTEIGSLKEIIGSLKDDLVKTAEKLEIKVARTLSSLEEGTPTKKPIRNHSDKKHQAHTSQLHHEPAPERNFFNDHLAPLSTAKNNTSIPATKAHQEEKTEAPAEPIQQTAPASEQVIPEEAQEKDNIQKTEASPQKPESGEEAPTQALDVNQQEASQSSAFSATDETVKETAGQQTEVAEPVDLKAPEQSMADTMLQDKSEAQEVKAAVITQLEQGQEELETAALADRELDEYEEIKRELEALENEAIFKPAHIEQHNTVSTPAATVAPAIASPQPQPAIAAEKEEKKSEKPSLLSRFLHKKIKKESIPEPAVIMPEQPLQQIAKTENSDEIKPLPEAKPEAQTVASAPEVAVQPEAVANIATEDDKIQSQSVEAISVIQESPEQKEESRDKHVSLADLFKKRKKKVKGKIDDGRMDGEIKRSNGGGKLAIAAAVILVLAVGTGVFFKIKNAENLRQMYISKAKENVAVSSDDSNKSEVPDEFSNLDPEKKYKEAYADLPFAETAWAPYSDNEFGITIEYPKNTSYRLKPVGSNNIWFLRKNGYLLKIEKVTGQHSLGEIRDSITSGVKYKSEDAVVRGNSTIHLVLQDDLPVKGNIYLTSFENSVYKIWYKTFSPGENTDDEQRVKKMLDSLDFIPIR